MGSDNKKAGQTNRTLYGLLENLATIFNQACQKSDEHVAF